MEYKEKIIYIHYLSGIGFPESIKEVELQNLNEPEIYAIRDECDFIVRNSPYAKEIEKEFGDMRKLIPVIIDYGISSSNGSC